MTQFNDEEVEQVAEAIYETAAFQRNGKWDRLIEQLPEMADVFRGYARVAIRTLGEVRSVDTSLTVKVKLETDIDPRDAQAVEQIMHAQTERGRALYDVYRELSGIVTADEVRSAFGLESVSA